jgi:hypothetical protein
LIVSNDILLKEKIIMSHLFNVNTTPCAFVHIPKCAGYYFKSIFGLRPEDGTVPNITVVPTEDGHWTYKELIKELDLIPEDYEFIAIVRNPWEKLVSEYFYVAQTAPHVHGNYIEHALMNSNSLSFPQYVKGMITGRFGDGIPIWDYLTDEEGKLAVKNIFRMETLNSDITEFLVQKGVNHTCSERKQNTSEHRPYQEYYDEETKQLVASFEKRVINHFGYEF